MFRRCFRHAAVLCGALLLAGTALAGPSASADQKARVHFESGSLHYDRAEYEEALREFEAAHALSQRPALLYNIAKTHEALGHLQQAVELYEKALASGDKMIDQEIVKSRIAAIRKRISDQQAKEQPQTPAPAVPASAPIAPADAPPTEASRKMPVSSMVAFGVAGAGLLVGATFGLLTMSKNSDLEDGCKATRTCTDDDLGGLRTTRLLSDIGWGVLIAGAATGTILWVTGKPKEPERAGSVRLQPLFVPGRAAGAAAEVTF